MKRVICLGVATLDQIFLIDPLPPFPAKVQAKRFVVTGGGMAANAAVAVQRLGGHGAYWGRIGTDLTGDQVLGLLKKEGVDVSNVRRLPNAVTKVSAILIDPQGERLVISAPTQGYPADASWLPLAEVNQAHAVHADTRWLAGATALFDAAHAAGIPSVLDADSGDPESVVPVSQRATHPIFSEPLLAALGFGEPEAALKRVFGGRNRLVGVTLGARGMHWFDGADLHVTPSPKVAAIDTLGAGDTFHGAYALALAEAMAHPRAATFAAAAAALKCTTFGGREGIPTRAALDAFLAISN